MNLGEEQIMVGKRQIEQGRSKYRRAVVPTFMALAKSLTLDPTMSTLNSTNGDSHTGHCNVYLYQAAVAYNNLFFLGIVMLVANYNC